MCSITADAPMISTSAALTESIRTEVSMTDVADGFTVLGEVKPRIPRKVR